MSESATCVASSGRVHCSSSNVPERLQYTPLMSQLLEIDGVIRERELILESLKLARELVAQGLSEEQREYIAQPRYSLPIKKEAA